MCRSEPPSTNRTLRALREPELPRVVGLLRRLRVRDPPRARVQRDPQRGGADRRLARSTSTGSSGHGRDAARGSDRHAGPAEGLRRLRSSTRPGATSTARRSTTAPCRGWKRTCIAGRRRIHPALVPAERRSASNVEIEDISEQVASLALQGPTSGPPAQGVAEADDREPEVLPRHDAARSRACRSRSRAPGYTGDLGYEIWIPWKDAAKVWDALMAGGQGLRHPRRPACSRSTSRASRPGCC